MTGINIPDAVTSIGSYAFSESGLTSIVISENVSEIGNYAFGFCASLTTVTLPEDGSLTAINWGAFNGCTSLTSINIPSTVTYLGTYAFSGCTSLEDLYLPASVTSINGSFHGAGNIRVHVPSYDGDTAKAVSNTRETNFYVGDDTAWGLRHSGENVHLYKYTGTAVEAALPEYVTGIGSESAFSGSSLKKLTVTDTLASVAAYLSFGSGADDLRVYVPTPDGSAAKAISNIYTMSSGSSTVYFVTGYDDLALQCRGDDPVTLRKYVGASENVVLPEFVTVIYESAFSGNTTVKNVTLTNVTTMKKWAFWQCTALETVTLNEGLTEISTQTFTGCTNLRSVNIPDSVTNIYDSAFEGLQNLRLTANCQSFGAEWAAGHRFGEDLGDEPVTGKQLRLIHGFWIAADSTAAGSGDGVRGGTECGACGLARTESRTVSAQKILRVPGMLQTIEEEAFAGMAAQQVTISGGVESIGGRAFAGCRELLLAVIPSSVTSIAEDAFANCDIAVICPNDSYAAAWCDERQIPHNP